MPKKMSRNYYKQRYFDDNTMMISKSVVLVLALAGLALPTAVGGAILQPAVAAEEDFSLQEILDFAFDLADIDVDVIGDGDDGGGDGGGDGGDGNQEESNVQQQDSTQDRTQGDNNVNQNTQVREQRQSESERIVIEDGGGDNPSRP
jgi:hypothetical protein